MRRGPVLERRRATGEVPVGVLRDSVRTGVSSRMATSFSSMRTAGMPGDEASWPGRGGATGTGPVGARDPGGPAAAGGATTGVEPVTGRAAARVPVTGRAAVGTGPVGCLTGGGVATGPLSTVATMAGTPASISAPRIASSSASRATVSRWPGSRSSTLRHTAMAWASRRWAWYATATLR
jgi:hypothetical protein